MLKTLKRILKFSLREKKLFFLALFLMFIYTGFNLLLPFIAKLFFDLVQSSLQSQSTVVPPQLWYYIVLYLVLTITFNFEIWGVNFTIEKWFNVMVAGLSKEALEHIQDLSLPFFEETQTGRVQEKMSKGVTSVVDVVFNVFLEIVPETIFSIVATIILFKINYILGFILLFCIPFYLLISYRFTKELNQLEEEGRKKQELISDFKVETISNVKTIKSFAAEDGRNIKFSKLVDESASLAIKRVWKLNVQNFLRRGIVDFGTIAVLGISIYFVIKGEITFGTLYLASTYSDRTFGPLRWLMKVYDNIQKDTVSAKRFFELMDTQASVTDRPNAKALSRVKGSFKITDLVFSYKEREILKGINLEIPAGKKVAFVGKSGVGKSTIVKLLMRFYDPQKGSILLDGTDLRDLTQKSLRRNIGVVMQDSILFNDTVMNNILFSFPNAKKADAIKAAKLANAHDFIMSLPKQYETIVGERGVKLSGGEQQRINIARVFLKNPPIIILDEATSSLDSESEKLIQDALWKLLTGKTAIIIAHRLSTVMRADYIAVIEKGKVKEVDAHEELLKKKGTYQRLFEIQSGGYIK